MYAIVRTGGKQYKVQAGDVIRVEKLESDLGAEVDLTDVLMIGGDNPVVGQPTVENAKVTVVITRQEKDRKVIVFKKRRRQGYRRFKTHRQHFTEVFIKSITGPNGQMANADSEPKVVNRAEQRQAKQTEKREKLRAELADKTKRQERKSLKKGPNRPGRVVKAKTAGAKKAKPKTVKAKAKSGKKSSAKKSKQKA